eukprot:6356953-Prymnesium_polylepis.2
MQVKRAQVGQGAGADCARQRADAPIADLIAIQVKEDQLREGAIRHLGRQVGHGIIADGIVVQVESLQRPQCSKDGRICDGHQASVSDRVAIQQQRPHAGQRA